MPTDLKNDRRLAQRPRLQEACLKLEAMAQNLGPEAKLPTTTQLRATLGVSVKTLNDAVRELERRNMLRSVNGVGIYVAKPAPATAKNVVGLLYHSAEPYSKQQSPYMQSLLNGIRGEASKSGIGILLTDADNTDVWDDLSGFLIYCNDPKRMKGYLAQLPPHLPRVLLLHREHNASVTNVAADDFGGAKLATEHLIAQGHRRISYLLSSSPESLDYYSPLRLAGYRAALAEAGIEFEDNWLAYLNESNPHQRFEKAIAERLHEINDPALAYLPKSERRMELWLEDGWQGLDCTAIVAHNDSTAIGVMRALNKAGLRVPEDVSVIGFDGTPLCEYSSPPLTTVEVPLYEIGARALQLLQDQINNDDVVPERVTLPVRFKPGQSVAPATID